MPRRRWSDDLAPDVLREIAGRLHVAADFVRFHAVCKPWRDSRDLQSGTTTTTTVANQFLPWLLASAGKHHVPLKLRCIFSKSSYRASSAPPRRSWVTSAHGDTLRYLTVDIIRPRLHDPTVSEQYNYVMESHGQLLWASVRLRYTYRYPIGSHHAHTLSVSVHALEGSSSTPDKMRWIRKDGRSLADRVLFLGSPNSFTIDADSLPGCHHGGCAYFVYRNSRASRRPFELFGVFRYNLVDGKSEFVERLPPEWDNEKCTWLSPQPIIAPIQEINERKMDAPKLKEQQKTITVTSPTHIINIERHYEPSLKVLVRNLPRGIDQFQLESFFNKHGKVSNSEIIYDKYTKTSDGKGAVTMTTIHVHREDAIAALHGLVLDGCRLEVILVNDGPRPRR